MEFKGLINTNNVVKTPSYVFNFDEFSKRCFDINKILGKKIGLCFSMKANPFLIKNLPSCFSKIEVCSHGEFRICKKNNINPDMIFYSGINKRMDEVAEALEYGVRNFTVESYKHISILHELSYQSKKILNIYPRIANDAQFGMDLNEVRRFIKNKENYSFLFIKGIHFFSGTQKKKSDIIIKELSYLAEVIRSLKETCGFVVDEIEYGTGLYIGYFDGETNSFSQLRQIKPALDLLSKEVAVTIEMGRFFAATSGYYFTKIDDKKENNGTNYLIVDGGINQLVYDGQLKAMRKPELALISVDNTNTSDLKEYTVCGSLCTLNDVIVRDIQLANPQIGDVIVFKNVGAYSFMEGMSVFLSREMPQIWGIINDEYVLLRDYIYTDIFNS